MSKMQRISTFLVARGTGTRRRLLPFGVVVLAATVPATPIFALGLLDRLWDDLSGRTPAQPSEVRSTPPPGGTAAAAPEATSPAAAPLVAQAQAQAIPVVHPKAQAVSDTLEITGNAAAVNEVKLIARVTGLLQQIHFEDGAMVRKGDLLFTIQQDQYKAQLRQALAQLQLQQAALVYAKTEVVRYTALLKREAATQVDVDHWNFEQKSAEANILSAQAQAAIAQLNLDYTEVRAPFDGLMGKHLIDIGNVVGGNGQQAALGDIMQLDPIYVVANISTQQGQQIRANLDQQRLTLAELHRVPVEAALSGETGFPHRGTLEYVAPAIDPATGTLLVRGILPNPGTALLPGVFVTVRLPMGRTTQSALLVPDRALQEDQGGRYVLVVGADDLVQQRYVQTGPLVGSLRVVTGGLKADDRVVIGELWRASPGTKVTPRLTEIGQ